MVYVDTNLTGVDGQTEITNALNVLKLHENPLYHPKSILQNHVLTPADYVRNIDGVPFYIETLIKDYRFWLENGGEGEKPYTQEDCKTIATYLTDKGLDATA